MKKLFLFLFLTVCLSACSSDDNSNGSVGSGNSGNSLNPPAWIRGTWQIDTYTDTSPLFKFISNDFCQLASSFSENCWVAYANSAPSAVNIQLTETSTNTSYKVSMSQYGQTIYYEFEKISANRIKWVNVTTNPQGVELVKVN